MTEFQKKISAVLITNNEEANLARCLDSLSWVDEIIVGDSGSTDNTIKIAEQYGAHVYHVDWQGFGRAKQFVVDKAGGDWILSIDADEVVTDKLIDEIKSVISSSSPAEAYYIPRITNFLGQWIRHSSWYPDYVLRLFKNDRAQFNSALVHEELICGGVKARLKNRLLHFSYPDIQTYMTKQERYADLAARELFEKGVKYNSLTHLIKPVAVYLKHLLFKGGFLDGYAGFKIAYLSAQGKSKRYAKLKELEKEAVS